MTASKREPGGKVDKVQLHLGKVPLAADVDARLKLVLDICRRLTGKEPTPEGTPGRGPRWKRGSRFDEAYPSASRPVSPSAPGAELSPRTRVTATATLSSARIRSRKSTSTSLGARSRGPTTRARHPTESPTSGSSAPAEPPAGLGGRQARSSVPALARPSRRSGRRSRP